RVDAQDNLNQDQSNNVPLKPEALSRLEQVEIHARGLSNEVELAGQSLIAVAELELEAQPLVEPVEIGMVPGNLRLLRHFYASPRPRPNLGAVAWLLETVAPARAPIAAVLEALRCVLQLVESEGNALLVVGKNDALGERVRHDLEPVDAHIAQA